MQGVWGDLRLPRMAEGKCHFHLGEERNLTMYRCLHCGADLNTAGFCPNWRCARWLPITSARKP